MSDTQLLTIALAAGPTMFAVLVGILINNARLSDTNTRIGELRGQMDARFKLIGTLTKCAISGDPSFIVSSK